MGYPFFFQRSNGFKEGFFPLVILCQRIIDKKQTVILNAFYFPDNSVYGARPEFSSSEIWCAAGKAVKPAAAGGMNEIDHLDSTEIIQIPV